MESVCEVLKEIGRTQTQTRLEFVRDEMNECGCGRSGGRSGSEVYGKDVDVDVEVEEGRCVEGNKMRSV